MSSETPAADAAPGDGAPASDAPSAPIGRTVEAWAEIKQTATIWHRSAFVREHWCEGLVVTEADYDQAVSAARGEVSR